MGPVGPVRPVRPVGRCPVYGAAKQKAKTKNKAQNTVRQKGRRKPVGASSFCVGTLGVGWGSLAARTQRKKVAKHGASAALGKR